MIKIFSGGNGFDPKCTIVEDGPEGPLTIERQAQEEEILDFERVYMNKRERDNDESF